MMKQLTRLILLTALFAMGTVSFAQFYFLPKEHFSYMGGNSNLYNAKIILMGDHHGDKKQDELRQEILNDILTDQDVVLIEGVQSMVDCNKQLAIHSKLNKLTSKPTVLGWDDMDVHAASVANMALVEDVVLERQGILDWMDQLLGEGSFQKMQEDKDFYEQVVTQLKQYGIYQVFKDKVYNYYLLNQYFNKLLQEVKVEHLRKRNLMLIETLDKLVKDESRQGRIYVMLGDLHINETVLLQYLETQSYMILNVKEFPESQESADDYYSF